MKLNILFKISALSTALFLVLVGYINLDRARYTRRFQIALAVHVWFCFLNRR